MPTTPPQQLAQDVEAGRTDRVLRTITDHPRLVHTFAAQPRPWGDELWLPLHRAAHHGRRELVALLLEHGAQPDSRTRFTHPDHARATALHLAAEGGAVEIVDLLIQRTAHIEVRDAHDRSPLACAARVGQVAVVRRLIEAGAQLEVLDDAGRTPLHLAIASTEGDANAAALALIDAGAKVNATCPRDPAGFTPLHRCVSVGPARLPVAQRLLAAGADRAAFDPEHQRTPRELAQAKLDAGDPSVQPYLDLL